MLRLAADENFDNNIVRGLRASWLPTDTRWAGATERAATPAPAPQTLGR